MSADIVGEKVWSVLADGSDRAGPFSHGYTYSGHPLGAAAANAVLDIVERENLAGNAALVGAHLQAELRRRFGALSVVGEVRGVGLMAAIEFVADPERKRRFDPALKVGARISKACAERGLIARAMPHGDILGFAPPLIVTNEEINEMIDIAAHAIAAISDELVREGVKLQS
jgi:L-2,4-diaminobutyrate transaminase